MRGRMVLRTIRLGGWDPSVLRELALAALFGVSADHLAGLRREVWRGICTPGPGARKPGRRWDGIWTTTAACVTRAERRQAWPAAW